MTAVQQSFTAAEQEERRHGVGASDVPAILGLDPYRSPLDVYLEKRGVLPAFTGNRFTDWGNRLEPLIAAAYADAMPGAILSTCKTRRHPTVDWAFATPDRLVDTDDATWLLECKNRGLFTASDFGEPTTDQVPDSVAAQCAWQMFVTGFERCDVAVLIGGNDFRHYTLNRDEALIARVHELVAAFWERVQTEQPPAPLAQDNAKMKALFPASGEALVAGDADHYATCRALLAAKAEAKELESQIDALEATVKLSIGDRAGLTFPDGSKVTWKNNKPSVVTDWKALAATLAPPADTVAQFTIEKPGARVLRLAMKEVG